MKGADYIAAYEGPLLQSCTEEVPDETAEWLQATEATGGFVYGGTAAIDEDTFDELEDLAGVPASGPADFPRSAGPPLWHLSVA